MRRVPELDGVRALAALAIVGYHAFPTWFPFGWAAVDLFFVLSGYLITSIILEHGHTRGFLRRFYVRRGLRIWPIYYLSLLGLVVASPILPRPIEWGGLPYYLSYTQFVPFYWSATAPEFSWYFKHTWTLAIEEQFYLIWPALVLLAGRRRLVPMALGLLAASVTARACGVHWWTLVGRGDGFAMGGLLAAIASDRERFAPLLGRYRPAIFGAGGVALAFLAFVGTRTGGLPDHGPPLWPAATVLALNVLFFGVVALVVGHAGCHGLRRLRRRWLVYVGTISYGLYLYHMIIIRLKMDLTAGRVSGRNFWVESLTLIASFAAAALSWRYVERPILALKDRFDYAPGAPRAAAPPASRVDPPHRLPDRTAPARPVPGARS
jgi:peptidoglycan/LPS O-acetylase OafA/YrhL